MVLPFYSARGVTGRTFVRCIPGNLDFFSPRIGKNWGFREMAPSSVFIGNNGMSADSKIPESPPVLDYSTESTGSKLARKTKDNPMMTIGLAGCAFVAVYGLYKYKNRGNLSASNYLMQLRVTAQGTVIACLTLGIMKSLYDRFTKKDSSDS